MLVRLLVAATSMAAVSCREGVGNVACDSVGNPRDGLPSWHDQPFGCHRDADGPVAEFARGEIPHPADFFASFVAKREPAVFRGAVAGAPGILQWTDERLMRPDYGELHVKLEGKREKRSESNQVLTGALAIGRDLLGSFVNRTRRGEAPIDTMEVVMTPDAPMQRLSPDVITEAPLTDLEGYVVSQLPEPMAPDVLVPAVASCGSTARSLLEANLWLSSGNTSSMVHRDADNVFNCMYKGSKTWTLIDPLLTPSIPRTSEHPGEVGGVALFDPDRLNATSSSRPPAGSRGGAPHRLPYRRVTVQAGDCLFLPWGYWHQVYSPPGRNIAVSLLYGIAHTFADPAGECDDDPHSATSSDEDTKAAATPSSLTVPVATAPGSPTTTATLRTAPWLRPVPLPRAAPLWRYDGLGDMSMGNADPEAIRLRLLLICRLPVSLDQFPEYVDVSLARELVEQATNSRKVLREATAKAAKAAGLPLPSGNGANDDAVEWAEPLDSIITPAAADAAGIGGEMNDDDEEEDEVDAVDLLIDPNSWWKLPRGSLEADVAAAATEAAAKAVLGRPSPFRHDLTAVLRDLESRIQRPLTKAERAFSREELSTVGMGCPVVWGGVVTRSTVVGLYARSVVSSHTSEEERDEDEDDDDSDWQQSGEGGSRLGRRQLEQLESARADAKRQAEERGASPEEEAAQVLAAEEALKLRWRAREGKKLQLRQAAQEEAESLWRALDPTNQGVVTTRRIVSVPRAALASALVVGAHVDPSNSEEWEFFLQEAEAVRHLLQRNWYDRKAAVKLFATMGGGGPQDPQSQAIYRFLQDAAAAGCGVLQLGEWRQQYLERLEGTDAAADTVSREVSGLLDPSVPCSAAALPPSPLTRPKTPTEGGNPLLPVPFLIAMPEGRFPSVMAAVVALYDRSLKSDPALDDIDALGFS